MSELSDAEKLRHLRHDIKNQLSSVSLALEQLKYELPGANEDIKLYLEIIENSFNSINEMLK